MAPLVHHFSPCTTYDELLVMLLPAEAAATPPLPAPKLLLLLLSLVMADVMLVASLLATAFSVMAKQDLIWPRSSGSSQVRCCSRVPYLQAAAADKPPSRHSMGLIRPHLQSSGEHFRT